MNLIGVINDRSYGVVCYNLLKELSKDVKCKLWELHPTQPGLEYDYNLVRDCVKTPYKNSTSIRIWHQHDLANHVGTPRVGFPIFELDQFNPNELEHLRAQDELLVCSHWAQSILEKYNLKSNVVPLGVDSSIFRPLPTSSDGVFRFVNVGKWEIRKGHDFLVKCFNAAFTKTDRVELYLSCHNPYLDSLEVSQWEDIYKKSPLSEKIKFLPWVRTQTELNQILNQMDAGVFLSRAEGWNLEATEMLAIGKPVILTNYSGHTEFIEEYKVEGSVLEKAIDGKWFFGQGNWMKLGPDQLEQTVEHMRNLYKNRPKQTPREFSWGKSAQIIKELYGNN